VSEMARSVHRDAIVQAEKAAAAAEADPNVSPDEKRQLREAVNQAREEAKALQEKLQLRQAEIETVANQIRKTEPNTPDFQRLQAQLLKLNGELRQLAESGQQAIQKKETTVYLAFYRTLDDEVAKYAKAKGLKLVLRQQEGSLDENQTLQEILKSLNRSIIYQDGLDITDDILKALDARAANK